jgi:hypothetical protein
VEGWPVFADYEVRYTQNNIRFTTAGQPDVAVAFTKYDSGTTVCFKPGLFAELEAQMEKDFGKMMQEIDISN